MSTKSFIVSKIIDQIVNVISTENIILKEKVMDPLIKYLERKLWWFYIIVTILLLIIIITNFTLFYKIIVIDMNIKNFISSFPLPLSPLY